MWSVDLNKAHNVLIESQCLHVRSFYNSVGDVNLDAVKEILADNNQVETDFNDYLKT